MDGRVELRAGMVADMPPIKIVPILGKVIALLQFDPGPTIECRKAGRQGMGKIDNRPELARCPLGRSRGNCRKARRWGPPKETPPRQRMPYRVLATGNTHRNLHPCGDS